LVRPLGRLAPRGAQVRFGPLGPVERLRHLGVERFLRGGDRGGDTVVVEVDGFGDRVDRGPAGQSPRRLLRNLPQVLEPALFSAAAECVRAGEAEPVKRYDVGHAASFDGRTLTDHHAGTRCTSRSTPPWQPIVRSATASTLSPGCHTTLVRTPRTSPSSSSRRTDFPRSLGVRSPTRRSTVVLYWLGAFTLPPGSARTRPPAPAANVTPESSGSTSPAPAPVTDRPGCCPTGSAEQVTRPRDAPRWELSRTAGPRGPSPGSGRGLSG